jgi:hypothetical protein
LIGAPPVIPAQRPAVILWYRIWSALFVAIYAAMGIHGICIYCGLIEPSLSPFEDLLTRGDSTRRAELLGEDREDSYGVAVICAAGALFYGVAGFVPGKPWGWVVGMIAIIGSVFPFFITAAGMIPLLIFWLRPETKRYFRCGS